MMRAIGNVAPLRHISVITVDGTAAKLPFLQLYLALGRGLAKLGLA